MTTKLVVIINRLKVPKIKKILLYEMKFPVPNYSRLRNPWLGGYRPQIPVLTVLCPQLNLLNPPPAKQSSWVRHWYGDTEFNLNRQSSIESVRWEPSMPVRKATLHPCWFSQNTGMSRNVLQRTLTPNLIKFPTRVQLPILSPRQTYRRKGVVFI